MVRHRPQARLDSLEGCTCRRHFVKGADPECLRHGIHADPILTEAIMQSDDEFLVSRLLATHTAEQLAVELVKRCGCEFDSRLGNDGPPVSECEYHRILRERLAAAEAGARG